MTRPSLLLLLCTALALAPLAARAQEPDDSPLGSGNPCFDTAEVESSLALVAPGSPDPLVFGSLAECPKLCKKAGLSCAKAAKSAGACELRWADDRAHFTIKVECAGLKGAALKTCVAEIEEVRATRRETALDRQKDEVTACTNRGTSCEDKCVVPP